QFSFLELGTSKMRSSRTIRKTIRKTPRRKIDTARALAADFEKNQLTLGDLPRLPTRADLGDPDLSPVPLAFLSRNGVVISAGASLFQLFEATHSEILNKPLTNLVQPRDLPALYKFISS